MPQSSSVVALLVGVRSSRNPPSVAGTRPVRMDPKADALTDEQKHVGEVFDAIPRCMVLGVTPEHIHTLQAAAKHPRIFRDLVEPILDGILSLPKGTPLRTPLEISKCKDQDAMTATVLLWLASHEGQVSDIGKATGDFLREFTTNLLNWRVSLYPCCLRACAGRCSCR